MYTLSTRVAFLAMGGERQTRMEVLDWLELNGGRVLEVSIGTGVNPLPVRVAGRGSWMGSQ